VTLGYLFGAAISDPDPNHGAALYDEFAVMRRTYDDVSEWTGVDPRCILRGDVEPANEHDRFGHNAIRLAALALGIHDILLDKGIRPGVVGGISLGGLIGACVAGAVARRDLFALFLREGATPQPATISSAQGAAIACLPVDEDPSRYYGDAQPDVYLGGDFGMLADGGARLLMLSGTRAALDRLAAASPPGMISVIDGQPFAVHSPLRQYAADFMAESVARVPMADPDVPVCSFMEQRTLLTADDIRDLFLRNKTHTMRLPAVTGEMAKHGTRLALVLGPTLPVGVLAWPFPVVRITEPEDITAAMTAIYEYDVELSGVRSR
jgi:[acyl-carrier-protein] S-malonyltransferase